MLPFRQTPGGRSNDLRGFPEEDQEHHGHDAGANHWNEPAASPVTEYPTLRHRQLMGGEHLVREQRAGGRDGADDKLRFRHDGVRRME